MGCILSAAASSCSTPFGNCANQNCESDCQKSVKDEVSELRLQLEILQRLMHQKAIEAEDALDDRMKVWIHENLHKHLPAQVAPYVEHALVEAIDYDIIDHNVPEPRAFAAPPQIMAPSPLTSSRHLQARAVFMSPMSPSPTPPNAVRRIRQYHDSALSPSGLNASPKVN
jgi:hypothetical protein